MIYQIRLYYYRYFKSYNAEIKAFMSSHNYQLIEIRKPNKEDWNTSPFKKPKVFEVSIMVFQINKLPIAWTDLKYKVLTIENNRRKNQIRIEIKTTYFKKPHLNFKTSDI
tara:strand:+ start:3174 stop:3503 length:330 start_codon:yes stop_codon:yes gene_type:complete